MGTIISLLGLADSADSEIALIAITECHHITLTCKFEKYDLNLYEHLPSFTFKQAHSHQTYLKNNFTFFLIVNRSLKHLKVCHL